MDKSVIKIAFLKNLGWASIALCGLCCALPVLGGIIRISSFTLIAYYFEKISIIILVLGFLFFIYISLKKKKISKVCSASCGTDCECKT